MLISEASSPTLTNIQDAVFLRSISAITENAFDASALLVVGDEKWLNTLNIKCPSGSVNGLRVSRITDGPAIVYFDTGRLVKAMRVSFLRTDGVIYDQFQNYTLGSFGRLVSDAMDSAATSGTKPIFNSINHQTSTYIRNPNCWVGGDWTGRPVWASGGGGLGAAISPRHIVTASHAVPSGTIRFVSNTNLVVERTIVGSQAVGQDITIVLLSSDLPQSISFYKVLPTVWNQYVKTFEMPLVFTDGEHKCLARKWFRQGFGLPGLEIASQTYTAGLFSAFSEDLISGDSGSPGFFWTGQELIVHGTNYQAGGELALSEMLSHYVTDINAAMTALGGGYQLSVADLSSFTNYN